MPIIFVLELHDFHHHIFMYCTSIRAKGAEISCVIRPNLFGSKNMMVLIKQLLLIYIPGTSVIRENYKFGWDWGVLMQSMRYFMQ